MEEVDEAAHLRGLLEEMTKRAERAEAEEKRLRPAAERKCATPTAGGSPCACCQLRGSMLESVTTLRGEDPDAVREAQAKQPAGTHADYVILTEAERTKGFVRPVRAAYKHVGIAGPTYPVRDLTDDEHARYADYVKFEAYPPGDGSVTGRYWTQADLDRIGKGCGTVTKMGVALAETYARNPGFYGATFCCGCNLHLPVGVDGEFVWDGTTERVGT